MLYFYILFLLPLYLQDLVLVNKCQSIMNRHIVLIKYNFILYISFRVQLQRRGAAGVPCVRGHSEGRGPVGRPRRLQAAQAGTPPPLLSCVFVCGMAAMRAHTAPPRNYAADARRVRRVVSVQAILELKKQKDAKSGATTTTTPVATPAAAAAGFKRPIQPPAAAAAPYA
jgi:hypothetical protein